MNSDYYIIQYRRTQKRNLQYLLIRVFDISELLILNLKFKMSNQNSLLVPRNSVIFRGVWWCIGGVACPVPGLGAEGLTVNLSDATSCERYTQRLKAMKNVVF